MPVINIQSILSAYTSTLTVNPTGIPTNVVSCLKTAFGIDNPTLPFFCAVILTNSSDYNLIRNCLTNYGAFTDEQISVYLDCIYDCRVGATVGPRDKGYMQWKDCCGNVLTQFVLPGQTYTISGCVRNNSVQSFVDANNGPISFSSITYGSGDCFCPPPSPTPTPTVTPTIGFTPTPTPTPTVTRTPTLTPTLTPTPTKSPFVYVPITPIIPFPTPTPSPSFNPTPTPSVTPNIQIIGCGTNFGLTASSNVSAPATRTYQINLGSAIGNVQVGFNYQVSPDTITVVWNNQTILKSPCQDPFEDYVENDPRCEGTPNFEGSPTFSNTESYKIWTFYKSAATPSFAYVTVRTPSPFTGFDGVLYNKSVWSANVACPDNQPRKIGPNSLLELKTNSELTCFSGSPIQPQTITVGSKITVLPNWSQGFPVVNGVFTKNRIYFEGGIVVNNPLQVPTNAFVASVPNFGNLDFYNFSSGSWVENGLNILNATSTTTYTYTKPSSCGGGTTQVPMNQIQNYRPVTVQYNTPGTYSISIRSTNGQMGQPTNGYLWYEFKDYIRVIP
jgi:hypothetical protein